MGFSTEQVQQLLQPVNHDRVMKDPRNNSHLSQQDVTAHLIRVFGFGGFDTQVLECSCVYDSQRPDGKWPSGDPKPGGWDACYKVILRLSVKDKFGEVVCTFEDGSTGDASNQVTRADAHDLAMKSALSLAKKRCAVNLGDQFGLSLYNKGQEKALVKGLVKGLMPEQKTPEVDVQEGVDRQVSLGVDEVDKTRVEPTAEQQSALESSLGAKQTAEEAAGMPSQQEIGA